MEANIRYLPLYPDEAGIVFNELFLRKAPILFSKILPDYSHLEDVVRVIDVADSMEDNVLHVAMNAELEEALGYFGPHSEITFLFNPWWA